MTLQALQGKMREVGEIKLAEMTGQGRALISFYSDFDADKCISLKSTGKPLKSSEKYKRVSGDTNTWFSLVSNICRKITYLSIIT